MSKLQIKNEIMRMVTEMEGNTFLLPESWSPEIQMASSDMSYKTYVGTRGINRYMHIQVSSSTVSFDLHIVRDEPLINGYGLFSKAVTPKQVLEVVTAIYNEKHSFVENAEGIVKLRKQVAEKRKIIKSAQGDIKNLEQQIKDFEKLRSATPSSDQPKETE